MEPGHVKVLSSADQHSAVANWVASDVPVELSVTSHAEVLAANVLVNVRVHGDPDEMAPLVERSIAAAAEAFGLRYELSAVQYFRPARPVFRRASDVAWRDSNGLASRDHVVELDGRPRVCLLSPPSFVGGLFNSAQGFSSTECDAWVYLCQTSTAIGG